MKKLITGAVAALALLFGFASCSGDLHDNDVQPLTIAGLVGVYGSENVYCVPMKLDSADGSEQSLTFKYSLDTKLTAVDGKEYNLTDGWGWKKQYTTPQFKIIPSTDLKDDGSPKWAVDYGWETDAKVEGDIGLYLTPGSDYQKLLKRGDAGTTSAGPSNVAIEGAIIGETYTIKVKYDASSESVSIKVAGLSSDPSAMKIVLANNTENFPATDKDGKVIPVTGDGAKPVDIQKGDKFANVKMDKSGSTYTYQFISTKTETLEFYLENDLAGKFGGINIPNTTYKVGDNDIPDTSDLELNESTTKNFSFSVLKDVEYKFIVDISKGMNKATIRYEIVDLLKDSSVNANFIYSDTYFDKKFKEGGDYIKFKAENDSLKFTVNRNSGGVFGVDDKATFNLSDDEIALKYTTDKENEKDTTKAKTIELKGFTVGKYYRLKFTRKSESCELSVKAEEVYLVDLENTKFIIAGDMNDWPSKGDVFIKTGDKYVASFVATSDSHQFAIHENENWGYKFCSGTKLELGKQAILDNGGGNASVSGLIKGKKYNMEITTGPDELNVTVIPAE